MARNKITQVTSKEIEDIINNSVQSTKNRLVGNAAEQKKMFVRPIANTDGSPNVAKLVQRLAKETEEAMQQLENNVEDLEDSLVAPPPADSIPLSGVFLTYDRATETLEIVGEQGVDEEDVSEIVGTETNERFTELDNSITALSNSKQDKIEIADNYDSTTNKVATEATISKEVAKVIGGAGESFDTLKEIADWIIAHPNSVAEINAKIAENTAKINTHTRDIALNTSRVDRNTSDIAAQAQRVTSVQSSVNALSTSKQDKLSIADGYSSENPVATVRTVSDKIAEVVGGADASFDTLKEIADWINNNPESVAAINTKLSEHAQAIANNAEGITENALAIEENEEAIERAEVKATQAANTANEAARRIGVAEADIANLRDGKQNVLMFADEYSEQSKVATERTVEREVAKIVADAPDDFNTLKEIATWIAAHPNDISMLNALVQENSRGIALNASLIVNNTKAINDNAKRINNAEIGLNDVNEYYSRLSKTVEDKADNDTVSKIMDATVEKTNMPNQLYGTDADGNPALYPTDSVGTQVLVDGQKVKEFNADSKQDVVAFDGGYDKNTNKAATVKTVTDKIAEVIADAPEGYDTLEEIARWITEHPNSVAEINARIAANTESIQERVKYDDFGQGFSVSDDGAVELASYAGALQSRTGFPVLGYTMDDAWKEVATNNQAKWEAADWEAFYAFIGAVKDYHNNRDGLARFNDGRLSVSDPSLKSASNVVNVRTLLKQIEEAKTDLQGTITGTKVELTHAISDCVQKAATKPDSQYVGQLYGIDYSRTEKMFNVSNNPYANTIALRHSDGDLLVPVHKMEGSIAAASMYDVVNNYSVQYFDLGDNRGTSVANLKLGANTMLIITENESYQAKALGSADVSGTITDNYDLLPHEKPSLGKYYDVATTIFIITNGNNSPYTNRNDMRCVVRMTLDGLTTSLKFFWVKEQENGTVLTLSMKGAGQHRECVLLGNKQIIG